MRWFWWAMAAVLCLALAVAVPARQQDSPPQSAAPETQLPRHMRIRVGANVAASQLISHVQPVYPPLAITARISGTVTLHAVIGDDGTVKTLDVVSGPEILQQSAMDAVKQWRYAPTHLNGQPVEVDTRIIIVYSLSGDAGQDQTPSVQIEGPSGAQSSVEAAPIDPQLKADIVDLLHAMRVEETEKATFQKMYQTIRPAIMRILPDTANKEKIADAYGEKLEGLLISEDYTNALIQIYAKSLSDDDIKAMIAFYGTPAGQHYLAAAPQITTDASQLGMRIASGHMVEIFKELCSEYPELQSKAGFCTPPKTKTSELNRFTGRWFGD